MCIFNKYMSKLHQKVLECDMSYCTHNKLCIVWLLIHSRLGSRCCAPQVKTISKWQKKKIRPFAKTQKPQQVKGTVHPQKLKKIYIMLRTVTKNSTIIITKYTWYLWCREIIQITGGPPLWLHQKPDSKAGKSKLLSVNIWAIWIIFLLLGSFWLQQIWLYVYSWRNFNNAAALCPGIILSAHLFTWFCMGCTHFGSL